MRIQISKHGIKRYWQRVSRRKGEKITEKIKKVFFDGIPRKKIKPGPLRMWVDAKFHGHREKLDFRYIVSDQCLYIFGPIYENQETRNKIVGYELVTCEDVPDILRQELSRIIREYYKTH